MDNSQIMNKSYDVRLNWLVSYRCNLKCTYCFRNLSKASINILKSTPKIKISNLIKTLNKTKKTYRINFRGMEPFLIPNIIEASQEISKQHFVSYFTNLVSKKIRELTDKLDPDKVSKITGSFHFEELEKNNLLDRYVENFHLCKERGFNIIANVVPHPSLLNVVEKYKEFLLENEIHYEFRKFVGEYNGKQYPKSYTEEDFKKFNLKKKWIHMHYQKGKLCNVGYNNGIVRPNGDIFCCDRIYKPLGNIYKKIKFNTKLIRCPFEVCYCPHNMIDPYLLKKAIKETKLKIMKPTLIEKYKDLI